MEGAMKLDTYHLNDNNILQCKRWIITDSCSVYSCRKCLSLHVVYVSVLQLRSTTD